MAQLRGPPCYRAPLSDLPLLAARRTEDACTDYERFGGFLHMIRQCGFFHGRVPTPPSHKSLSQPPVLQPKQGVVSTGLQSLAA